MESPVSPGSGTETRPLRRGNPPPSGETARAPALPVPPPLAPEPRRPDGPAPGQAPEPAADQAANQGKPGRGVTTCPRCGGKLVDPDGLGWCQRCGYCHSL